MNGPMLRHSRWLPALGLLFSSIFACPALRAQSAASEDDIRAAMVQHLALFVDWPGWKMDTSHPQFNVCLLGSDPIAPALIQAFRDRTVMNKPVNVQRVRATDKLEGCHVLYIGAGGRKEFVHTIAALQQAAVLTVSERPTAAEIGQIVGLPESDAHVVIQVNLRAAQSSRLNISSRLLQIATITERP